MTSAQQSLNLDKALCMHYYHCVLSDIPFQTPVSAVASHVVPKHDSDAVKRLAAAGCRVVPHQLHVFKEPLDTKFGYVSFFVHQQPTSATPAGEVHRLVREWIDLDLSSQLAAASCTVQLAQPPECHSSEPFLNALRQRCPLLDPGLIADTKKLETFLLTRVKFGDRGDNASINDLHATQLSAVASTAEAREILGEEAMEDGVLRRSVDDHEWKQVGSFSVDSLKPKELLWLKKQVPSFPPVLITNGNVDTTHCDEEKLKAFFESSLSPLIALDIATAATP